jgi:predicted dehydrogenase
MTKQGVGIIGCGNISTSYLGLAPMFDAIEMRAVADINPDAARGRADEYGVRADTVEALLASNDIDIVVNLTIPAAHFEVSSQILKTGKHVYSEKPFVLSLEEGAELKRLADAHDLRIGSAPDTFLGGAHQMARKLIDDGAIGRVTSGTCFVMGHGMEHWHPNPDFFYLPGAGPVLDIGPYYITNLIQLIGPIRRVAALSSTPSETRTILSEPRRGESIPVKTPTTIYALLEFENGAAITLCTSWDVWGHGHKPMELYGTEGSLDVPDPNFFSGDVVLAKPNQSPETVVQWNHPFGILNQGEGASARANYRTAGLADMATAIQEGRTHRCSLDLALHAVDAMTSILKSGETGQFIDLQTSCKRPEPLDPDAARALMA